MSNEQGAVFDEFVQGGFLDDADVLIKSARFAKWNYNGTQKDSLFLRTVLVTDDGTEHEEYLSAGDLRFFVPSTDGTKAIPVGAQTKMNSNSNFGAFVLSLKNADTQGTAREALSKTDNISAVLEGMRVHVVRVAQPKRPGIVNPDANISGQQERARTNLTVNKVIAYSGQTAPAASAPAAGQAAPPAAAPAAAPATAAAPASGDVADAAFGVLMEIVSGNGGSIEKGKVAGKVFTSEGGKALPVALRNQVLGLIVKDDYLNSLKGQGVQFDGTTIKLG